MNKEPANPFAIAYFWECPECEQWNNAPAIQMKTSKLYCESCNGVWVVAQFEKTRNGKDLVLRQANQRKD